MIQIKAAPHVRKKMVAMLVMRACLHRIGRYEGLDIASPQSGNIVPYPLLPHTSEVSDFLKKVPRIDIASEYCFGHRRRPRLCP